MFELFIGVIFFNAIFVKLFSMPSGVVLCNDWSFRGDGRLLCRNILGSVSQFMLQLLYWVVSSSDEILELLSMSGGIVLCNYWSLRSDRILLSRHLLFHHRCH